MRTLPPLLRSRAAGPALALLLAACGGTASSPAPTAPARASEAEWRALATPRPAPLEGAARVAVGEVKVLGTVSSPAAAGADLELGLSELVAAGLLRRRDVHFVERRRFSAAVEAERLGRPRPQGAPAAGTSPGARWAVSATWATLGLDSAVVDLRLTDLETGAVVGSWRGATAPAADPVSVARTIVAGTLAALDRIAPRPAWADPEPAAAPLPFRASGVPEAAVAAFFRGVAAEERWAWEEARAGFQGALATGGDGFVEAAAALARTARLRSGGTLGEG